MINHNFYLEIIECFTNVIFIFSFYLYFCSMKNTYGFLVLLVFSFWACEEIPPRINFQDVTVQIDTSYAITPAEIPAPGPKVVYIEDITGVQCPNCPRATERIKDIKAAIPGGVVSIALYTSNFPALTLPGSDDIDLRSEQATDIHSELYSRAPMPGGGINRRAFDGEVGIRTNYLNWNSYAEEIREEVAPFDLNISIESDANGEFLIIESITLQNFDKATFVMISLVEDEIITPQKTYDQSTIYDYEHNYVLREMLTPITGLGWLPENTPRGIKSIRSYKIEIPNNVKRENASYVVALAYNDEDSKEILQAARIKLP
jgi:hypothetical protein